MDSGLNRRKSSTSDRSPILILKGNSNRSKFLVTVVSLLSFPRRSQSASTNLSPLSTHAHLSLLLCPHLSQKRGSTTKYPSLPAPLVFSPLPSTPHPLPLLVPLTLYSCTTSSNGTTLCCLWLLDSRHTTQMASLSTSQKSFRASWCLEQMP